MTSSASGVADTSATVPPYTLKQLAGYFLRLGAWGFGGPVALVGSMHRDLVSAKGWFAESDYNDGLALAQLAPGPLAAQVAFYLGYLHYGLLGAAAVGLAFVLPSFVMVVALGALYVQYGGLAWMQAVFYGVSAAVIGIIALSAYKLTARSLGRDPLLWAFYLAAAAGTAISEREDVRLILGAGVVYWLVKSPPQGWWTRPHSTLALLTSFPLHAIAAIPLPDLGMLGRLFAFFAQAGTFVFGSGLAIVPFLYGGVVEQYGWLNSDQFVDAVAVAMITPGPVVITTGFIGYLVAGFAGAVVAAAATFLPCFLLTVVGAPWFRRYGKRPGINAFVTGVTAGAVGAITGAVVVLGRRSIIDLPTALICLSALLLLWRLGRRIPEPAVVVAAALLGLLIHPTTI